MANWETLKSAITDVIKTNGNQEITGQVLQDVLLNMVSSLGENATYAGLATPDTNPGAPDGPVFYFALEAGTYNNFNGIEIEEGGFYILMWDGSSWSLHTVFMASQELGTDENKIISQKTALISSQRAARNGFINNAPIIPIEACTSYNSQTGLKAISLWSRFVAGIRIKCRAQTIKVVKVKKESAYSSDDAETYTEIQSFTIEDTDNNIHELYFDSYVSLEANDIIGIISDNLYYIGFSNSTALGYSYCTKSYNLSGASYSTSGESMVQWAIELIPFDYTGINPVYDFSRQFSNVISGKLFLYDIEYSEDSFSFTWLGDVLILDGGRYVNVTSGTYSTPLISYGLCCIKTAGVSGNNNFEIVFLDNTNTEADKNYQLGYTYVPLFGYDLNGINYIAPWVGIEFKERKLYRILNPDYDLLTIDTSAKTITVKAGLYFYDSLQIDGKIKYFNLENDVVLSYAAFTSTTYMFVGCYENDITTLQICNGASALDQPLFTGENRWRGVVIFGEFIGQIRKGNDVIDYFNITEGALFKNFQTHSRIAASSVQPTIEFTYGGTDADSVLSYNLGVCCFMPNYFYLNIGSGTVTRQFTADESSYICAALELKQLTSSSTGSEDIAQVRLFSLTTGLSDISELRSSIYNYIILAAYRQDRLLWKNEIFYQNDIDSINENIESLQSQINLVNESGVGAQSKNVLYYEDFTQSDLSEWSDTYVLSQNENGITLTGTDVTYLKRMYVLHKRNARFIFINNGDCQFRFGIYRQESNFDYHYFTIDTSGGTVNGNNNILNIDFDFEVGKKYIIDMEMEFFKCDVTVTDYLTGTSKSGTYQFTVEYDTYGFQFISGTAPTITEMFITSKVKDPFLIIMGDSITQGGDADQDEYGRYTNSWAYLTGEAIGQPYLICGRGSGSILGIIGNGYVGQLETTVSKLRPKYLMVMIGTNGNNTTARLETLINTCESLGVTLLLNNVPCRARGNGTDDTPVSESYETKNELIDTIRKQYQLNGARMNIATSVNNDGETLNTDLFAKYEDYYGENDSLWLHPNVDGHEAMFERVKIDCPELFD